ncbi:MAG: polymerase subunit tau [Pseudomonadota bacterium]|jgi:DNA polymerase-3 subunit gamma/tau
MSYLVLARKYRPQNFTEMVGQEHVVQALTNALVQQRLHHAYLFTGTRGVGKTTVSRILAKSLNCQGADGQGGITAEPCGVCQACRDIDAGRFVDYTELDAASNRGVDEVQSLLEQAVYKPVQGRFKVFMIDEVHMLTNTAFNAMLKTLEEPPEYLKFVLATTDPQKVPVTVLSRCLQFNLRPMAPETVLEHLTRVLAQENIEAETGALRLLARAARGSMRDALSLTDQAIAYASGALRESAVRQMLGSVDQGHVYELIEALTDAQAAQVVALIDALRVQGVSAAATLEDMSLALQRMAVAQWAGQPASLDDDPDGQRLMDLAQRMDPQETQLLYSLCLHGRQELGLAPDEYAALTMVLLRLLAFKPAALEQAQKKSPEVRLSAARAPSGPAMEPAHVATPVSQLRPVATSEAAVISVPVREAARPVPEMQGEESAQRPAPSVMPSVRLQSLPVRELDAPSARADRPATEQAPAVEETTLGTHWFELIRHLMAQEQINALPRELALQSQLVEQTDGLWTLCLEKESLNTPNAREKLQAAVQAAGHPVRLQWKVGAVLDTPAKRLAVLAAEKMQAAQDLILQDPLVQNMMQSYGAKIVPGSLQPIP